MRPRHYSISSSPLHNPENCSITYGIINEEAYSGQGQFIGVAGSYLRALKPGDTIQVSVRSTNKLFRLPVTSYSDASSENTGTPIIMFAAGTGLAPFRGFLEERAVKLQAAGNGALTLPPALLFVGCRSATKDRLYAEEIDEWARQGAADVRYALSQEPKNPIASSCKYVQDRMLKDKEDIVKLWEQGAKVFLCGSPGLVESVGKAARDIFKERAVVKGLSVGDEEVEKWFSERRNVRFVADVFR
jgi:cytochrome P450 / NADPH-cytochrome P450 reductase